MQNKYLYSTFIMILSISMLGFGILRANQQVSLSDTSKVHVKTSTKITDTRLNRPTFLKKDVKVKFVPFIPDKIFGHTSSSPVAASKNIDKDKVLNNVKVYPNPVSDQLNLTYNVNKDSNVIIKIMDVLGNEVATLLSQRMSAGEQNNSFSIAARLNSGFYFIRVIVGNETVIKRISVL